MFTVYGIHDASTNELLYIGCTMRTLETRMNAHLKGAVDGPYMMEHWPNYPASQKYYAFHQHVTGERKLEIRAIVRVESKATALKIEKAMILAIRPPLNTRVAGMPGTRWDYQTLKVA